MNDDEAFIRAIVDRPGDDTPRLAYADWLDEHADPRGAYLRAEHEWAKPWQVEWSMEERKAIVEYHYNRMRLIGDIRGPIPEDSLELRQMASGFDPVWVARVTRPPIGVCCDHLKLVEQGSQLSAAEIDAYGVATRAQLPHSYRAFLLNHNGGLLPHETLYFAAWGYITLTMFYGIGTTGLVLALPPPVTPSTYPDEPRTILPVIAMGNDDECIGIYLSGEFEHQVAIYSRRTGDDTPLCLSFEQFVGDMYHPIRLVRDDTT